MEKVKEVVYRVKDDRECRH